MAKLKSIIFVAGVMLLILAAVMGYLSIKYLSAILPADSYEDKGVYTFSPYQVLPDQALTRELGQEIVDAGAYVLLYVIVWCVLIFIKKGKRGSQVW